MTVFHLIVFKQKIEFIIYKSKKVEATQMPTDS